jgi:hypothetical protein
LKGKTKSGTKKGKCFDSSQENTKGQHRKDRHDQDAAKALGRAQVIGASPQTEERTPYGNLAGRKRRPNGAVRHDPIRAERLRPRRGCCQQIDRLSDRTSGHCLAVVAC